MQWLVQREDASITIDAETLIQTFLANKTVREDHKFLAYSLVQELQRIKSLGEMPPDELASLALFIGYYFRVFLEQNDVEEVEHADSNNRESDFSNFTEEP